ncbi:hypothetical protein ACEQ8H_006796 [Pleosporales sp. CAS-2024a]
MISSKLATIPDSYLYFGLGIFTFVAISQVSRGLTHIRALTRIHHPCRPSPPASAPTHQEDTISTSSLLTLALSPSLDIRNSATKILCQRFYANAAAKRLWTRDLQSTDETVKHRAQLVYNLLSEHDVGLPVPRERWRVVEPVGADEERDVRRRRREAVVIHDGEGEGLFVHGNEGERRFDHLARVAPEADAASLEHAWREMAQEWR